MRLTIPGAALSSVAQQVCERRNMIIEALKSLLIGIVEGVTEWLPISSTGHMIIVDDFVQLQVSPEFLALFLVVIQIGAILAVLTLYFRKLNPISPRKTADEKRATWRLWGMVVIGCIPAAIIGILFDDWVNAHFYNKVCVAAMLILYGVVFIVLERRNRRRLGECRRAIESEHAQPAMPRGRHARMQPLAATAASSADVEAEAERRMFRITDVDHIDWKTALKIGCFQVRPSFPAPPAPAPLSSAACCAAAAGRPRRSSRSSWPSPSCSAGAW